MKATELQINDWVFVAEYDEYTPAPHNKPYPVQILHGADIDRADEISFEPIPLTPEILEKNGFHKEIDLYYLKDSFIGVRFKDGYIDDCRFGEDLIYLPTKKHKILYVHTLQHALRLCGLNELADNFKI